MEDRTNRRTDNNGDLVIDNVLSTQPELGPTVPDGGYGWVVFFASLFFQALIPSLLVSFGIFLAFDRMERNTLTGKNPLLWDNKLLHVPLFFVASWTFFDSATRQLIHQSTWPKLVGTSGTCLTCAGLLFVWIGMTDTGGTYLFVLAGFVAGIGASIQMAQCEMLLAQYFRLKLNLLIHLGHAVSALGFIIAPIIIGHHIFNNPLMQIILWYQALILQGLVINLLFRKPVYLKSQKTNSYNYITANPDDEEDIFSKNSRELQIKVQNNGVQIEKYEITPNTSERASTSVENGVGDGKNDDKKNWVSFDDDDDEEVSKYERVTQVGVNEKEKNVDQIDDPLSKVGGAHPDDWETFEDEPSSTPTSRNNKNLHLEMSFGEEPPSHKPTTMSVNGLPIPLFSDTPVNHNNTYSYDILEDQTVSNQPGVFSLPQPQVNPVQTFSKTAWEVLHQLTFYKTLATVITTKWSTFVFFAMFPSYLYQEVDDLKMKPLSSLIGVLSLATMLFSIASFWINVEKRWRPKTLVFLSWVGALGYLMIADYSTRGMLLFGAAQITVSLAALHDVGGPLLGLTIKGEPTKEYTLICVLSGLSFLFFTTFNFSFKYVFRMMSLLHFLMGFLWLGNYIYKRLKFW